MNIGRSKLECLLQYWSGHGERFSKYRLIVWVLMARGQFGGHTKMHDSETVQKF